MGFARRINLYLASPHFFPTYGGAQLRFLRYLPGFRERNIFARVVTGTPKAQESANTRKKTAANENDDLKNSANVSLTELDGVPIHRIRLHGRPGWRRSLVFSHALLTYCDRPDSRPDVLQMIPSLQPRSAPWLHWIRKRLGIPPHRAG
jgi:hypothetical protein